VALGGGDRGGSCGERRAGRHGEGADGDTDDGESHEGATVRQAGEHEAAGGT
jgi:hypothetical protein